MLQHRLIDASLEVDCWVVATQMDDSYSVKATVFRKKVQTNWDSRSNVDPHAEKRAICRAGGHPIRTKVGH
jgi:hypothetical protein